MRRSVVARTVGIAALMALSARPLDDMTEDERKTPPSPKPEPEKPKNLPGETNRQFAARMKAEKTHD
jgi:hypothetical protein